MKRHQNEQNAFQKTSICNDDLNLRQNEKFGIFINVFLKKKILMFFSMREAQFHSAAPPISAPNQSQTSVSQLDPGKPSFFDFPIPNTFFFVEWG